MDFLNYDHPKKIKQILELLSLDDVRLQERPTKGDSVKSLNGHRHSVNSLNDHRHSPILLLLLLFLPEVPWIPQALQKLPETLKQNAFWDG